MNDQTQAPRPAAELSAEERDAALAFQVERLLRFGRRRKLIKDLDVLVARNTLLDLLGLAAPYEGEVPKEDLDTPTAILEPLLDLAAAKGLFDDAVPQYRINFETRLMGAMMPRESEVCRRFRKLLAKRGPQAATDWFYDLCVASNYIRTAQIARNIQWSAPTPYGEMEITINLTKPEKDPKVIAMERLQPAASYPKCMLCKENIGYAGRINFPARQTHRIVPLNLAGETFYLQYSPYAYFHEHCIILHDEHKPMAMDRPTLAQIFDFVSQYPHYTCGSNADLPIVGGSILSHAHFQGGRYVFPMQKAPVAVELRNPRYPGLRAGVLHWPVSTIRLTGRSSQQVQNAANDILDAWRAYSDESVDILSHYRGHPAQHRHADPALRRAGRLYPRPCAAQQPHKRTVPRRHLPPAQAVPQHQKGEHRPDRGHGPCDPARPPEGPGRADCRYPVRRAQHEPRTRQPAGRPRRLDRHAHRALRHVDDAGGRRGRRARRHWRSVLPCAGGCGRLQAGRGRAGRFPAFCRKSRLPKGLTTAREFGKINCCVKGTDPCPCLQGPNVQKEVYRTMAKYETMLVTSAALDEEASAALIGKFKSLIEANGTIDSVDDWGKRRLAYPINDETEGVYTVIKFTADPAFPAELDRVYKITEGVLRTIIVAEEA